MRRPLLLLLTLLACTKREIPASNETEAAPVIVPLPEAAPSADDPRRDTVRATSDAPSLSAALEAAKPFFAVEDASPHMVSDGSLSVAYWAAGHMKAADVIVSKDETSWSLAQKDIGEARGKRLCRTGRIDEIKAMTGAKGLKFFAGGFVTTEGTFQTLAVASTGSLVHGSTARFCGVVTSLAQVEIDNRVRRYVYLVGMFDLPDNRAR